MELMPPKIQVIIYKVLWTPKCPHETWRQEAPFKSIEDRLQKLAHNDILSNCNPNETLLMIKKHVLSEYV